MLFQSRAQEMKPFKRKLVLERCEYGGQAKSEREKGRKENVVYLYGKGTYIYGNDDEDESKGNKTATNMNM